MAEALSLLLICPPVCTSRACMSPSAPTETSACRRRTTAACFWATCPPAARAFPMPPYRALSQSDVDANYRAYSQIAHMYAAAKSQIPVGAEVYCVGLLEPLGRHGAGAQRRDHGRASRSACSPRRRPLPLPTP